MAAVAIEVSEATKWDQYLQAAKRPDKATNRELSRASDQTKWVMSAMQVWHEYYHDNLGAMGLSGENWIRRLWQPRQKHMNSTPRLPEPPAIAAAVEAALPHIRPSRSRVLVACELFSERGVPYAAGRLKMSPQATSRYLEEARQSLADILRAGGWPVPHRD